LVDKENPAIFAYTRELYGKKIVVLLNFTDKEAQLNSDLKLKNAKVLLGNYTNASTNGILKPYEAVVLELN